MNRSFLQGFLLLVLFTFTSASAACPGMGRAREAWEYPAYQTANSENKDLIERGLIGVGMSIEECRAAWRGKPFLLISQQTTAKRTYETYRVESFNPEMRGMVWVYLYLEDGVVVSTDERRQLGR
jgi:hypothetical protein